MENEIISNRYQVSTKKYDGICVIDTFQEDDGDKVIVEVEKEVKARILVDLLNEKEDLINEKPLNLHEDFTEWDGLLNWLQEAEHKLVDLKQERDEETQKILVEFDFKAEYGKNNETIRKNHIKKELAPIYDEITTLELDITDTKRRISFLKSLIKMKIELIHLGVGE